MSSTRHSGTTINVTLDVEIGGVVVHPDVDCRLVIDRDHGTPDFYLAAVEIDGGRDGKTLIEISRNIIANHGDGGRVPIWEAALRRFDADYADIVRSIAADLAA